MSKNEQSQTLFQFILSKQVQAVITVVGLLVVLANLWLVSKLSPLATAIDSLEARADSTDDILIQFVPRSELEATFDPIQEDIREIKQDVKDIRNAVIEGN